MQLGVAKEVIKTGDGDLEMRLMTFGVIPRADRYWQTPADVAQLLSDRFLSYI